MSAYRPVAYLIVAVALGLAFSWGSATRMDTMLAMGTVSILAVSLGLVYGQAGMLSVAQAAFAAIGAYATAILTLKLGWSPWLGLVVAVLLPAAVAYVLARAVVRLSPLALGVATLLVGEVVIYGLSAGGDLTGGFVGIAGILPPEQLITREAQVIAAWVFVVVAVVIVIRLTTSQFGRSLRTIAYDEVLAKSVGINVPARLSAVFALGGAIAGTAGWMYAHSRSYLSPGSLPALLSLEVLMMVIIGGKRTVLGPIAGTVGLMLILDSLPGTEIRGLLYGITLIAALLLFPNGLLAVKWRRLWLRGKGRASSEPPVPEPVVDPGLANVTSGGGK